MKTFFCIYYVVICFIGNVNTRKCYRCNCDFDWTTNTGSCLSTEFLSSCMLQDVGNQYCFLKSSYNENMEQRIFDSIETNNLQDSHFIEAIETISLSGTTWLPMSISSIGYSCDWDGCNHISLAQYLPESFQMNINQTILDSELVDKQNTTRTCYSCSKCINSLTATLCRQESCISGICFIDELHNYITTPENNCTYNFNSTCQLFPNSVETPSIQIRATYYLDFLPEKQLQINEIDVICTKNLCNSIAVVEYLKSQVQTTIHLHEEFRPSRPDNTTVTIETSTSSLTTVSQSTSSSSLVSSTTTGPKSTLSRSSPMKYWIVIPTVIFYSLPWF